MTGVPPAEYQSIGGRGGYAAAFAGILHQASGLELGAGSAQQTYTTSGSDNDEVAVDGDTVSLGVDTSANAKTAQVALDAAEVEGRMLLVYDEGGAAATDDIDVLNSSDTSVYTISTNNEAVLFWYVNGTWLHLVFDGGHA